MVTVQSVLHVDIIKENAELVAGQGGLEKVVSYVTIMEAPDFCEWVTGGEFVLTTWYAFSQTPELQVPAFRALCQTISAIGIKTGRFIAEIPQEIIDIANECNVPVFRIKHSAKFREVIQGISAELNNYQTNLLLEVDKHYHDLVKITLTNGNASSMLSGIGRRGQFSCFCMTHDRQLIGSFVPTGIDKPEFSHLIERVANELENQKDLAPVIIISDLHIFPCTAHRLVLGFLVIVSSVELGEKLVLMCQQVATFVTMKLLENYDTEQKMLAALFDDIIYHHQHSASELEEKLAVLGLPIHQQYRVIVLQTAQEQQSYDDHPAMTAAATIQRMLGGGLVINRPDEIVILAGNQSKSSAARPVLHKTIADHIHAVMMVVAIGPSVANATDIVLSYQIARQTAKVARLLGKSGEVNFTNQLTYSLLSRTKESPEHHYLLQQIVSPLTEHDTKYHTNLLSTLETVLFARDLESAAALLHIHVNTLRYRLQKVYAITGSDFFTPSGRYELTTACLVAKLT